MFNHGQSHSFIAVAVKRPWTVRLFILVLAAWFCFGIASAAAVKGARIYVVEDDANRVDVLENNGVAKTDFPLDTDFDRGDGFAVGTIDDVKAVLVAEDDGDRVQVYIVDEDLGWVHQQDYDFQLGVDLDGGDAFMAGDLNGDDVKDIVVVEDDGDQVDVLDQNGKSIRHFQLAVDFDQGDGFAVGDIDGDGVNEVLVAEDDGDRVDVLDQNGKSIRDFQLRVDFDGGDAFAVADLNGDGTDEVLVVEDDEDWVDVLDQNGRWVSGDRGFNLEVDFDQGDALAVSN